MKRFVEVLSIVAVAVLLTGCVLGHSVEGEEPIELRCRALVKQSTRTTAPLEATAPHYESGTNLPLDGDFGLWAFSLPREKRWDIFSPDAEVVADNLRFTAADDALWYPPATISWNYNNAMTIVAYAPYEVAARYDSRHGVVVDLYDTQEVPNRDILYSEMVADALPERNAAGVNLTFHHALAKVDLRFHTPHSTREAIVIRRVLFEQIHTEGSFQSLPQPTWNTTSTLDDVTVYQSDEGWALPDNNHQIVEGSMRLMMPQCVVGRVRVEVDMMSGGFMHSGKVLTSGPINILWEPGKYYTYTLNISANSLALEEPEYDE